MQTFTIIAGIILFFIIWALIEQKHLITTRYRIESAKLPKELNNTSFVVLADLHNCSFGKNNKRLIKRIEELSPDFILVAGDMINKKEISYPSNAFTLLEALAEKYEIYYGFGNHEQRMAAIKEAFPFEESDSTALEDNSLKAIYDICSSWTSYLKKLDSIGVKFLDNDSLFYKKNGARLRISGISIGPEYFSKQILPQIEDSYIRNLIGEASKKDYQILIAHNPIYFADYTKWGADLTISGHLHGGLVRIPGVGGILSPQYKFFPKYDSGSHTDNGQSIIISRGMGTHSSMPRLFNVPELLHVVLKNAK